MKSLFFFLLLAGFTTNVEAQALDIGGIEFRLGQSALAARTALGAVYKLRFDDDYQTWEVSSSDNVHWIGQFKEKNNVIVNVVKVFEMSDVFEAAHVYTRAIRELYRRGGTTCFTLPVEMRDKSVSQLQTNCGMYVLTVSLPSKTAKGENLETIVAMSIGPMK